MAIKENNLIVYQDLLDYVHNNIKRKCQNIDEFSPTVPNSLKNGYKWDISRQNVALPTGGSNNNYVYTNFSFYIRGEVKDSLLKVVPMSLVKLQLNNFLSSRGIATKPNEYVSFKSIMNFYNNVSAFLATKLVFVSNSYINESFIFYNNSIWLNIS